MKTVYAKYLKTEEITFKRAKGMRDIVGKEFHQYHELFLFQHGEAEFISERRKYILRPNDLVLIPKGSFHQFVVNGDERDYVRSVLNFSDVENFCPLIEEKMRGVQVVSASAAALRLFSRLAKECGRVRLPYETELLLKSCLALLLLELDLTDTADTGNEYRQFSWFTREALRFIDHHMNENVAVSAIAETLHVSVSHLNHSFKKDLHIPLHRYMLEKRLIEANRRIAAGTAPTQAAAECGFCDYSGFYRQYKKMFQTSPSGVDRNG